MQVIYDVDPWLSFKVRPCEAAKLKKEDSRPSKASKQQLRHGSSYRQTTLAWPGAIALLLRTL
jgi:hypothetical protein